MRVIIINSLKVLAYRTAITPASIIVPMMLATGIGLHRAGIYCKALTAHQTFDHAPRQH